jgi:hypothetical protein
MNYSISPFPDGREKIQSCHCGKRSPNPPLINLCETAISELIPSLEEA